MDFDDSAADEALAAVNELREQLLLTLRPMRAAEAQLRGLALLTSQLLMVLLVAVRDSSPSTWAVMSEGLRGVIADMEIPPVPDGFGNVAEDVRRQALRLMDAA